jgi:hypothetical protein
MKKALLPFFLLSLFTFTFAQDKKDTKNLPKLTPDEIVAKHLESIGSPEAIAAVKTRVIMANGSVGSARGYGGATPKGPAQFASDSNKVLLAMIFNSNEFPYEKAAFDGKEQSVGLPNGQRTPLSEFLNAKKSILKEGLLGGALSSAWPLLDVKGRKAKLEYGGTDNIDGRPVYKLKYIPRDELKVTLYFDAETFQHVMTQYQYSVEVSLGASSTDIQSQKDYFTMTERFADFRKAGSLTLPFSYMITVDNQKNSATLVQTVPGQGVPGGGQIVSASPTAIKGIANGAIKYTFNIAQVFYNEPLEASVFKVS